MPSVTDPAIRKAASKTLQRYIFDFVIGSYRSSVAAVSAAQALTRAYGKYVQSQGIDSKSSGFRSAIAQARRLPPVLNISPLTMQRYKELYRVAYADKGMLDDNEAIEFNHLHTIINDLRKY